MYLDKDYYLYDFYNERESWGFYTETEKLDSLTSSIKNEKEKLNYLLTARNWTCPSSFIAKCPAADQSSRDTARNLHLYEIETSFYKYLCFNTER